MRKCGNRGAWAFSDVQQRKKQECSMTRDSGYSPLKPNRLHSPLTDGLRLRPRSEGRLTRQHVAHVKSDLFKLRSRNKLAQVIVSEKANGVFL